MKTLRRRLPLFFRRRDRRLLQVGYGVRMELWTAAIGITPAWGLPGSPFRVMKVDGRRGKSHDKKTKRLEGPYGRGAVKIGIRAKRHKLRETGALGGESR